MWKVTIFSAFFVFAVTASPAFRDIDIDETRDGRIVGGDDSRIEDFPYQVSLRFNGRHTCGGSILNENTVLSAAHCTFGRSRTGFSIIAGESNNTHGTPIVVSELIEHPQYDRFTLEFDIVILKLAENLVFDATRRPLALPTPNFQVAEGRLTWLAGWGTLSFRGPSPQILQSVQVPVLTNARCQEIYPNRRILDQHICAGEFGRDACQGDSGGPLVYNNVHVGIVSWGTSCAEQWPTVYVRVSEFLGFILQHA